MAAVRCDKTDWGANDPPPSPRISPRRCCPHATPPIHERRSLPLLGRCASEACISHPRRGAEGPHVERREGGGDLGDLADGVLPLGGLARGRARLLRALVAIRHEVFESVNVRPMMRVKAHARGRCTVTEPRVGEDGAREGRFLCPSVRVASADCQRCTYATQRTRVSTAAT